MNRSMRAVLAERIGTARVRRIVGPDWPELAREIVDQVCDELGIEEYAVRKALDPRMLHEAEAEYLRHMEETLRRGMGRFIAENSIEKLTTLRRRTGNPSGGGQGGAFMEMKALVITRMPDAGGEGEEGVGQ